ncbi:putative F-box/FBD/LRR-repeat protein At3g49030 [Rhododendron vialii]|uniref:putative F-box/FBD/LRR-repeat protein At3g49030 n=1 Tax=Rhododendron vialii TaxID=182163 RepID=UPI00266055A4|nr:putative F-box/FBD/LRR-repeat protein At3g49030 [Rhododendron vialii]
MVELRSENVDSAHKLIHGSPVLEYLDILLGPAFESREVLNISVPTLKLLKVDHWGFGDQFMVNSPKLEYLDLSYFWAEGFSLENLSSLLEARINIGYPDSGPISSTNILNLLRGMLSIFGPHLFSESPFCPEVWITDTLSIRFYANFGDYVLPTFHTLRNLTHLRLLSGIDAEGFDLNLPSYFLECSPNVKVLVLQGCSLTKSWSPRLRVPRCLLFHLKEVEFLEFGRAKHEFEVVEYLLKSA